MRIFLTGPRGVGKSTLSLEMLNILNFRNRDIYKYFSIDEYRIKYSDGSLEGEKLAYMRFIGDCGIHDEQNCIIECTGRSIYFPELMQQIDLSLSFFLFCDFEERQKRIQERSKAPVPFPYIFNDKKDSPEFDTFRTNIQINTNIPVEDNISYMMGMIKVCEEDFFKKRMYLNMCKFYSRKSELSIDFLTQQKIYK